MDQKLTISDIKFLYKLAAHKTDEELAILIKKPVSLVQMQFALMTGLPKRPWERGPVVQTPTVHAAALSPVIEAPAKEKPHRKNKATKPAKEEKKLHSASAQALERTKLRKNRNNDSIYKTRTIDLTGKIALKLNAKTTVWAEPGSDINELKTKYHIA
jgi:hypothetical protein